VGGDLIPRVKSCPRVVAPVVRRRLLSQGSCTDQCMVRVEGGVGVGGRGEACTSRAHDGNDAHPPSLSIDVLCWSPLCYPLFYSLVLFFLQE